MRKTVHSSGMTVGGRTTARLDGYRILRPLRKCGISGIIIIMAEATHILQVDFMALFAAQLIFMQERDSYGRESKAGYNGESTGGVGGGKDIRSMA